MLNKLIQENKKFFFFRIFWFVLFLKIISSMIFSSHFIGDLFIPFLQYFVDSGFKNPWEEFVRRGILDAFPYSSVMLLVLSIPHVIGSFMFGSAVQIPPFLQLFFTRLPLLCADTIIYLILCRWFETKWKYVLTLYWCSPVVFYISYVHGQLDSIPTLFLVFSLWFALSRKAVLSGICLGLGIGAKFNVAIAAPFIFTYLIKSSNRYDRKRISFGFVSGLILSIIFLIGPLLRSEGYRVIVLGTSRMSWIYDIFLPIQNQVKFYLAPGVIFFFMIHFFNYRWFTKDMIVLYLGLVFTTLVVLVPPGPGWFLWSIPFLVYFLIQQELASFLPFWTFNFFYIIYYLFFDPQFSFFGTESVSKMFPFDLLDRLRNLCFTLMQSSLALIDFWIYRIGVHSIARYKHRTTPMVIGIAGDSATGKHTISKVFLKLLNSKQTLQIYGDDYHRWPRGHEEWKKYTHLDPRGNYIDLPAEHLVSLKKGIPVSKSLYNHGTGEFTSPTPVDSKNFIIFLGLHPFLTKKMRSVFDLKIFMDPEESLHFSWKLDRDQKERGYNKDQVVEEIKRREIDSKRYISPQRTYADWILRYHDSKDSKNLKVTHLISSEHTNIETLIEELLRSSIKTLEVKWSIDDNLDHQVIEFNGTILSDEVKTIAYRLFPNLEDVVGCTPDFCENYDGIHQLILLSLLTEISSR